MGTPGTCTAKSSSDEVARIAKVTIPTDQAHCQSPAACKPPCLQHLVGQITHCGKSGAQDEANRIELPQGLHPSEEQACPSDQSRTDRQDQARPTLFSDGTPQEPG